MNHAITIRHLTVFYRNTPALWDICLNIPQGILLGIVGPNGAGKTTLIKSILGLIKPHAGLINTYNNNSIAYIAQRTSIDWDFPITVLDVVLMGRYKHIGWFSRPKKHDYEKALQALDLVGMSAYADRHISELSGGQQQRIFVSRALAQEAEIYLLDEPFIGIDMATEKIIINILKKLRDQGKTIIVVHHDIHTLHAYFDWLLYLNIKIVSFGPSNNMPNFKMMAHSL
jgi:manganese/zinc/iron transport system ATP- binding protein